MDYLECLVEFLRSSFANTVDRKQAVKHEYELKHIDSINDFLESLTNLIWCTTYTEVIAKDMLNRGFNREVGLTCAHTPPTPHNLNGQMVLIRDLGHSLNNFKTLNKINHDHHFKSNENSHDN